jgi:hypothetical protein
MSQVAATELSGTDRLANQSQSASDRPQPDLCGVFGHTSYVLLTWIRRPAPAVRKV